MKILLGNNTLSYLGGSETWTYTLAKELNRVHTVACYAPLLGVYATKLRKLGIECLSEPKGQYDAIIASHYKIVNLLKEKYPKVPLISTIHGIIHLFPETQIWAPEHPGKADKFVAVSEEVQEKLKNDYEIDSVVIRNFFEIEDLPINAAPKQFLFNSNYDTKESNAFKTIETVSAHYGAELVATGLNFTQTPEVEPFIRRSDIVVGMGRSVLEGVAKGRLGIVHGRWGTGGVVCEENVKDLQYYNFSGRNNRDKFMSAEELIAEIDKHYNPKTIDWQMVYMKNQHNVEYAKDKFIQLCLEESQRFAMKKP